MAAACIDGSCASTVCLVGHGQSSLFVRKYLYTPCFCVVARALDTYARAVHISPRPRIKRYILCFCGRNVRLFFLIICRRFCRGMHSPSHDPPATAARPSHTRCQMKPSPPRVRSLRAVLDQMLRAHVGAMKVRNLPPHTTSHRPSFLSLRLIASNTTLQLHGSITSAAAAPSTLTCRLHPSPPSRVPTPS